MILLLLEFRLLPGRVKALICWRKRRSTVWNGPEAASPARSSIQQSA